MGLATLSVPLAAQRSGPAGDLSIGGSGTAQRMAVSGWLPVVSVTPRLTVGTGARVSVYVGDPATYTSRELTQGALGPTLSIDPRVYALNLAVFGELSLNARIAVGANLDIVGFATGPKRTSGSLVAEPQTLAYFRYGAADHGALNSEFFVALRASSRLSLRAGASHYVTNYSVTDTSAAGAPTSRYQRFETVPFVAAALRL